MKVLDRYFDRVCLMTLGPESERARRAAAEIRQHTANLRVVQAIRGDDLYPAPWYRAGNGAWGCLQTHVRIAQDAWLDKVERYLVFEDDAILIDGFERLAQEFLGSLPENWDQVYLGGQHTKPPRWVNRFTYEPRSVNRTHCFGLQREAIPEFLSHVTDARAHLDAGYPQHIDHRLEDAHQSRRWVTYAPSWWLVGQGENHSGINGRWHPDKWWDHPPGNLQKFPWIWVDREPTEQERRLIHFGWSDRVEGTEYLDPYFASQPQDEGNGMRIINAEAFECRRLAAASFYEAPEVDPHHYLDHWEGDVFRLSDMTPRDLEEIADYPGNGMFQHRWLNPK